MAGLSESGVLFTGILTPDRVSGPVRVECKNHFKVNSQNALNYLTLVTHLKNWLPTEIGSSLITFFSSHST